MAYKHATGRYRKLYAKLLHLYPEPFRRRFSEGMAQTFNDMCRERKDAGGGLFAFALWAFVETSAGIVRERTAFINMQKKNVIRVALVTAFLLLLPLLAMQFTDEVNWDLKDFVVAGALLFGAGLAYELGARKAGHFAHRAAIGLAVATALVLVWVNLAVGLIGSEENPANLMYIGVLAVVIVGTVIARFRPHGMARTLFATALAQALVPVIALIVWKSRITSGEAPWDLLELIGVNAFFVLLFIGSALLFRNAARRQHLAGAGPED